MSPLGKEATLLTTMTKGDDVMLDLMSKQVQAQTEGLVLKYIVAIEGFLGKTCRENFKAAAGFPGGLLRHEACIFGGDDFAASIGATRSPSSSELMFARQSFIVHCRAYGVQPIDIVNVRPLFCSL